MSTGHWQPFSKMQKKATGFQENVSLPDPFQSWAALGEWEGGGENEPRPGVNFHVTSFESSSRSSGWGVT